MLIKFNRDRGLYTKMNKHNALIQKFKGIQLIRNWFTRNGFLDVMTPSIVDCPGIEPHLHPFSVHGVNHQGYLQTSPEFHMKELLSHGLEKIFTLTYSFRDEPTSETHRPQFIMLEWYRANEHYLKIKEDTKSLVNHLVKNLPGVHEKFKQDFKEWTIKEAFLEFVGINLDEHISRKKLYDKIESDFSDLPLPARSEVSWDDLFFILFLNIVEPALKKFPKVILTEYPSTQAALSTIKENDQSVCERFEVYLDGLEIGNCFNELTDLSLQRMRYNQANLERKRLYNKEIPEPKVLFGALERGLPESSGIAIGVERLLGTLLNQNLLF